MYRIQRIFNSEKRRGMTSSNQRQQQQQHHKQRKLERRNAVKNFEYEPSPSSLSTNTSSSSEELTAAVAAEVRTRSLDFSPLGDKTSFRIDGNEGEFEMICERLGFEGNEDFAIPIAAYEAMKVRSASDVLPRSIGLQFDGPKAEAPAQLAEMEGRFVDNCSVSGAIELETEHSELNNRVNCHGGGGNEVEVCELADKLEHRAVITANSAESGGAGGSRGGCGGGGGGIKGVRPPVLAPPPSISLPVIDNECSTWDLLKSLAPNDGDGLIIGGFCSDEEEEEVIEEIVKREATTWLRAGENGIISASCSFTTTSNDDDSSSTTTEPLSNISPNGRFKRIVGHWDKGELLGRGSFGSVYEGIDEDGFFFAVKQVSLLDQGDQARQSLYQLEQEIALLSQFEHENIVQYYGTDKDESNLYIFLEFVTKGSLLSLYQKYHLRDSQVSAYTRQILHGLKYLHDRNVVHRDIKCANILVAANGLVKLADFGLAKATKLNDVKSCKGTAFWMAPEVVRTQGYGLAADIWSLGCTVLEMLTQQIPYSHLECMQALFRIGRGEPPPVPDTLSRDARDFIFKCLQVNSKFRPSAAQLLDHPFVKRPLPLSSASASPYNFGRRG